MRFVDLSHPIEEEMPLYPGTPSVKIHDLYRFELHGYREKQITFTTHTGTHVDAPAHMLANGVTLDRIALNKFYGPATVLDVRDFVGKEIPVDFLQATYRQWQHVDFILLYSGYDRFWGNKEYFKAYPVLSIKAADFLMTKGKLKGLGSDTISPDVMDSADYPIHHRLMSGGCLIIENLTHMGSLVDRMFTLSVFPLSIRNADGLPVRAVALADEM